MTECAVNLSEIDYSLEKIATQPKIEAILFLFKQEQEVQDQCQAEISLLFFDGKETNFDKSTDELIDQISSEHFIEFIKEDLSTFQKSPSDKSGLLHSAEKQGLDRLIEAFECCMWSNMRKKKLDNSVPQTLLNDLAKQEKEKQEFLSNQSQEENKQSDPPTTSQPILESKNDEFFLKENPLSPEEEDAESMLILMSQIKDLKEKNKTLSDEERRKNAEDLIIKLSQYMNLDDGELRDYDDEY